MFISKVLISQKKYKKYLYQKNSLLKLIIKGYKKLWFT